MNRGTKPGEPKTQHVAGWKNAKHVAQWTQRSRPKHYPVFGELPVEAVDVGLVMKALEPIWSTKSETASRLRGRIESVIVLGQQFDVMARGVSDRTEANSAISTNPILDDRASLAGRLEAVELAEQAP